MYIDAEKLIAKIKELNLVTKTYDEQVAFYNALAMVVEIITFLQQKQPEVDLEKENSTASSTTWKECRECGIPMNRLNGQKSSPATSLDFDTEVYNWLREHGSDETRQLIEMTARHFWEMAQNSGAMLIPDKSYEMGRRDERMVLMKDAIECEVIWIDGPILNYTQEQQDMVLEKINAHIGDKVKVIIVKEDKNE